MFPQNIWSGPMYSCAPCRCLSKGELKSVWLGMVSNCGKIGEFSEFFHFEKLTFFGEFQMFRKLVWESNMGVSENYAYPQIIHFNRVFHYKPSILGEAPLFLETPICLELGFWKQISPSRQVVSLLPITVRPCGRHDARGRSRPGTSSSGRGALRGREKQRSFGVQL